MNGQQFWLRGFVSAALVISCGSSNGNAPPTGVKHAQATDSVDFSAYSSTADLLADSEGLFDHAEDIAPNGNTGVGALATCGSTQPCVTLDQTQGLNIDGYHLSQSMKYTQYDRTSDVGGSTDSRCGSYTISRSVPLPQGGVQEIWVEVYAKFETGFLTQAPSAWGCTSDQGLKFVDANVNPGDRFSIGFRTGTNPPSSGQVWFGYPDNVTDPQGKVNFGSVNYADGLWHRYRLHCKISTGNPGAPNADGVMEGWIDDTKVVSETGIMTTSTAGNTPPTGFNFLSLARNMNQGPDHDQSFWWGRVAIYTQDPGW